MTGAEMIAKERQRQIDDEGYTAEHDDLHDNGELAMAAACYAAPERIYISEDHDGGTAYMDPWPWGDDDKRPCVDDVLAPEEATDDERIALLTKAGAFCAAEIDRLKRAIALRAPKESV